MEFFDHPRIIPVKFGDNPPCGLGGDFAQSNLLTDDGWLIMDIIES